MTDQELKDLVASLAAAQVETDRELKELARGTDRQMRETAEVSPSWYRRCWSKAFTWRDSAAPSSWQFPTTSSRVPSSRMA